MLISLDKIFYLVLCKCEIVDCSQENHNCSGCHILCSCPRSDKVPDMEAAWLKDQRAKIGTLGGSYVMQGVDTVDANTFKKYQEKEAKKARAEERRQELEQRQAAELEDTLTETPEFIELNEPLEEHMDDAFEGPSEQSSNQNRLNLDYFIAEVVRYGVSDRAAAALFNAAVKSVELLCDGSDKLAVDKFKISRGRESLGQRQRKEKDREIQSIGGLQCIGSDGKRV